MKTSQEILATVFPIAALSALQSASLEAVDMECAQAFVRAVYREVKNSPLAQATLEELMLRAERSEFPLQVWIHDITQVYSWLETRELRATLHDVVEYVACAYEGSDLQSGHSIDWYLKCYGFERCEQVTSGS